METVAERLNGEYEDQVKIEVIRWETSYYSAHETFQQQIPEAKDCDIVVSVFRARLGTELPAAFCKLPSGDSYPSGTAYEVLSAIASRTAGQPLPDVYVFRCAKSPTIELDDPNGPAIKAEWDRLKKFFDTWFHTPDGRFLSAFQNFESTDDFAAKIEDCLRQWLVRHGLIVAGKVWDRALKGPPFPGLVPYDSPQQDVFYGRYLDIAHAISHLRGAADKGLPFLALIGASDAGKSSLMRAGILPQILRPGTIPEVDLWRKVLVLPGVNPLQSLAEAMFAEDALRDELRRSAFNTPDLLAKLFTAGDPEASVAPIRAALDCAAAARAAKLNFAEPRPARLDFGRRSSRTASAGYGSSCRHYFCQPPDGFCDQQAGLRDCGAAQRRLFAIPATRCVACVADQGRDLRSGAAGARGARRHHQTACRAMPSAPRIRG